MCDCSETVAVGPQCRSQLVQKVCSAVHFWLLLGIGLVSSLAPLSTAWPNPFVCVVGMSAQEFSELLGRVFQPMIGHLGSWCLCVTASLDSAEMLSKVSLPLTFPSEVRRNRTLWCPD